MRIAIQGEPASFSSEAALKLDPGATLLSCALSAEVFRLLLNGEAEAAVIPIENSLAGPVSEHYDLLLQNDVRVEREFMLRISHNLIAVPGSTREGIRRVLSHPVALAQCRRFFNAHPGVEAVPFYDTAGSVKHVIDQGRVDTAAIASRAAALHYGGEILQAEIEDHLENYTRFFVVRRIQDATPPPSGSPPANKVSIAFSVANKAGTLVSALQVFAARGLNLTKIESRPVQGSPWQYVFYADYQLTPGSEGAVGLEELREHCSMVKELGRYPEAY